MPRSDSGAGKEKGYKMDGLYTTDLRHGFTEDEIRDFEHGEEKRELDLETMEADGIFVMSDSEIETASLDVNPMDGEEETHYIETQKIGE